MYWIDNLGKTLRELKDGITKVELHPNSVVIVHYQDYTEQAFFPDAEESRTDFCIRIIDGVRNRKVGPIPVIQMYDYDLLINQDREDFIASQQSAIASLHSQTMEV